MKGISEGVYKIVLLLVVLFILVLFFVIAKRLITTIFLR